MRYSYAVAVKSRGTHQNPEVWDYGTLFLPDLEVFCLYSDALSTANRPHLLSFDLSMRAALNSVSTRATPSAVVNAEKGVDSGRESARMIHRRYNLCCWQVQLTQSAAYPLLTTLVDFPLGLYQQKSVRGGWRMYLCTHSKGRHTWFTQLR